MSTLSHRTAATPTDRPDAPAALAGRPVVDAEGRRLGDARAFVADHVNGTYRFLVVTSGGLLGLPTVERLIPTPAVRRVEPEAVHIDRSYDVVRRCRIPDTVLDDPAACEAVYRHYDVHASTAPTPARDDHVTHL